mgnify:CR=1 FL=1
MYVYVLYGCTQVKWFLSYLQFIFDSNFTTCLRINNRSTVQVQYCCFQTYWQILDYPGRLFPTVLCLSIFPLTHLPVLTCTVRFVFFNKILQEIQCKQFWKDQPLNLNQQHSSTYTTNRSFSVLRTFNFAPRFYFVVNFRINLRCVRRNTLQFLTTSSEHFLLVSIS